jgi:hypothetical protein
VLEVEYRPTTNMKEFRAALTGVEPGTEVTDLMEITDIEGRVIAVVSSDSGEAPHIELKRSDEGD